MASRLKKLLTDGQVIDICEKYGWDYILMFKEGSASKRYCHAHAVFAGKEFRAELIACWGGRRRWNIENGFNAQKNDGFGTDVPVRRKSREHLIL